MYKMFAFWSAPKAEDQQEFEQHYKEIHLPLALAVPNLSSVTATLLEGESSPYYRVAELTFDDRAAFAAAAKSQEWMAMQADSKSIISRFSVQLSAVTGESAVSSGSLHEVESAS